MTWRPKNAFRVGAMRELVTIKRHVETVDAAGQPVVSYVNRHANVPASFDPANGGESMRGRQVEASVKAIFVIRKLDGITVQDRLTHGTEDYGITYIRPSDGGLRYLEVYCTQ